MLVKRGKRRTRKAEQLKSKYEQLNGIFSKAMYEDDCYPEAEQRMVYFFLRNLVNFRQQSLQSWLLTVSVIALKSKKPQ